MTVEQSIIYVPEHNTVICNFQGHIGYELKGVYRNAPCTGGKY
jgi:hypothetical protein